MPDPAPPGRWRLLSSRTILADQWLRIDAERLETPQGVIIDPWYLARGTSWACALASVPDGRVIMVEQYRRGLDAVVLELPAGMIDDGEEPAVAARRELREESGYEADAEGIALGCWSAEPAHNTVRAHGFVFRVGATAGALTLDTAEHLHALLFTHEQMEELIRTGRFCHGVQIAYWYAARARKLL